MQQCKELVVVVLSEDLSSLNLSLGDVAHDALSSRVLAARGSFGVAGFGAATVWWQLALQLQDLRFVSCCQVPKGQC